MIVRFI